LQTLISAKKLLNCVFATGIVLSGNIFLISSNRQKVELMRV
jgi:hypothetical protein